MTTAPTLRTELLAILTMTKRALAHEFTDREAERLLEARAEVVARMTEARAVGALWGEEDQALLDQILALDEVAVSRLRAPHADALAWLESRRPLE